LATLLGTLTPAELPPKLRLEEEVVVSFVGVPAIVGPFRVKVLAPTANVPLPLSVERLLSEGVAFFVARYAGEPAGCGGVKLFGTEYGEVKRMYVRPARRGLGLGKAVLDRLAEYARGRHVGVLRLETGIYQTEAIGLYEHYGFQRRPPFGEYVDDPLSVYMEKSLA